MNYQSNNKVVYERILHLLAGIALGYILFACKSSKSGCDAYSNNNVKCEITK
jgi:hypothetical protein